MYRKDTQALEAVPPGSDESRARFMALYERCYGSIVRYAWRRVGPDQAEDIASETFIVAWRRIADVPRGRELPWLYSVARKVIANRARREQRDRELSDALSVEPESDHAETVTSRQTAITVLRSLSEKDRELARLAAWECLDSREISIVLGCSRAAVNVRLHRLRKRLEGLFDSHQREEAP
ncbi:RNA polymerase sigma factor [Actinoallomurus sp. CA-150999]|uniref:RNA polymerase sigma factor n=1 Tax=Actinoallomurus sp. CA-150999 TaxID=3239887 RepID=UPI003D8A22F9